MTVTLAVGLTLQACSVVLLFVAFGAQAFKRTGPYFVFLAFTYHGVTEILQLVTSRPSRFRTAGTRESLQQWTVLVGAALILFVLGYIATSGGPVRRAAAFGNTVEVRAAATDRILQVFDWRVLAAITVPHIAIVGGGSFTAQPSAQAGLARQFLVLGVTLTAISFTASHPRRFLPVFITEMAATVITGQRQDVVHAALITLVGLAWLGRAPRLRSVITALLVMGLLTGAVNAARSQSGREEYNNATSVQARLGLIASGAVALILRKPNALAGQTEPAGERLDGNAFPGAVLYALQHGSRPLGLATVEGDVKLAVPSFLWPGKLSSAVTSRSEKAYQVQWFQLYFEGDFLPTQLGATLGYFGVPGLLLIGMLFGVLYGLVDRMLARRVLTPWRFIVGISVMSCAVAYEQSEDVYPIAARGAVVAFAVLSLAQRIQVRHRGLGAGRDHSANNRESESVQSYG